jgi:hypothetical protein
MRDGCREVKQKELRAPGSISRHLNVSNSFDVGCGRIKMAAYIRCEIVKRARVPL